MGTGRIFRNLAFGVGFIALAIVTYYAYEIYAARKYTIETVLPAAQSANYPLEVSALTPRQLDILLQVEDPNFFEHGGVDFSTPGAGITTITQALVKRLYFENFKPGIAKVKQTLIAAFALNPLMSKQEQLRLFINTVYLGPQAKGFAQAADYYFHQSFAQLTEDQYLALVTMIIAPTTFSLEKYPARNQERVRRIKRVVNGEYKPRGLFDMYYGKLDQETQKNLPPVSYFECYYN